MADADDSLKLQNHNPKQKKKPQQIKQQKPKNKDENLNHFSIFTNIASTTIITTFKWPQTELKCQS